MADQVKTTDGQPVVLSAAEQAAKEQGAGPTLILPENVFEGDDYIKEAFKSGQIVGGETNIPSITANQNPPAPVVESPPTPAPTVTPESTPQPTPQPAPVITPQPTTFTSAEYEMKIAELNAKLEAVEEFKKNPTEFLAKQAPGLIITSFNKDSFIQQRLLDKYGVDNGLGIKEAFKPDPVKALDPTTTDYRYTQDLYYNLPAEADSIINKAQESQNTTQVAATEKVNAAKKAAREKHNLSEVDFESKVWNNIKSLTPEQVIEHLTDAILLREQIATLKNNIHTQANPTNVPPPSIITVGGAGTGVTLDKDEQGMEEFFGKGTISKVK